MWGRKVRVTQAGWAGPWSRCSLTPSCGPPAPQDPRPHWPDWCCLHPHPSLLPSPCTRWSPHRRAHSTLPPDPHRSGEFGFCDSTVDSEHSPRGEVAGARPFLSLCGPSGSGVFTLSSRRGREFTALSRREGLSAGWGMCVWLAGFPRETFGFVQAAGYFILSPPLPQVPL